MEFTILATCCSQEADERGKGDEEMRDAQGGQQEEGCDEGRLMCIWPAQSEPLAEATHETDSGSVLIDSLCCMQLLRTLCHATQGIPVSCNRGCSALCAAHYIYKSTVTLHVLPPARISTNSLEPAPYDTACVYMQQEKQQLCWVHTCAVSRNCCPEQAFSKTRQTKIQAVFNLVLFHHVVCMQPKPQGVDLNADLTAEEVQMMQAMGIPFSFDTTQGKHDGSLTGKGARQLSSAMGAREAVLDVTLAQGPYTFSGIVSDLNIRPEGHVEGGSDGCGLGGAVVLRWPAMDGATLPPHELWKESEAYVGFSEGGNNGSHSLVPGLSSPHPQDVLPPFNPVWLKPDGMQGCLCRRKQSDWPGEQQICPRKQAKGSQLMSARW
eukprot:scaffold174911_cov20-Tisochrysis_lutea.AAC.3